LPKPIEEIPAPEIARRVLQEQPGWSFPAGYANLTFALATGIGKTRLMGAIMAYLYRTDQSRNFVLLAPRDAILRKLEAECREASPKYIFVNRGVIPQPNLCHRGNLSEFNPRQDSGALFQGGPNVFVFSPQLLTAEERIAKPSEFFGSSILDYLKQAQDLVVLVDESHHISGSDMERETRSWKSAIANLQPKLVFSMTATPRGDANIAHQYGLAECLREGHYTKSIRMIVDSSASSLSDDEYDSFTLKYGISRLRAKENALNLFRQSTPAFPGIRPVLLVCAQDTKHADKVGKWLIDEGGFRSDEVLVIHSKQKTEEDLRILAAIEHPTSKIRAIVQVHVLDEGWDVTNVYTIAPLRNVRSYVNGRQVMGRGLRLPMGYRVGSPEVDTLDVLAFGQETFKQIYEQATREFGAPGAPDGGGMSVVEKDRLQPRHTMPTVDPDDNPTPETKRVQFAIVNPRHLSFPLVDLLPPEPLFDVQVSSMLADHAWRSAIRLGVQTTEAVGGDLTLSWESFVAYVVAQVIEEFSVLSAPVHGVAVKLLVEELLAASSIERGTPVHLDAVLTAKLVVGELRLKYLQQMPTYGSTGKDIRIDIRPYAANVPQDYRQALDQRAISWSPKVHRRFPCSGWSRCTHSAAHFDTTPEFDLARLLDHMAGVDAWLRNDPDQLSVPTLAGRHGPDFVVWTDDGINRQVFLVEVKGEYLWEPKRSDSWVKARDLHLWVKKINAEIGRDAFVASIVLGGDVDNCTTLEDIVRLDALAD
jgi:superfamily II DNA or RNA helicase